MLPFNDTKLYFRGINVTTKNQEKKTSTRQKKSRKGEGRHTVRIMKNDCAEKLGAVSTAKSFNGRPPQWVVAPNRRQFPRAQNNGDEKRLLLATFQRVRGKQTFRAAFCSKQHCFRASRLCDSDSSHCDRRKHRKPYTASSDQTTFASIVTIFIAPTRGASADKGFDPGVDYTARLGWGRDTRARAGPGMDAVNRVSVRRSVHVWASHDWGAETGCQKN